MTECANNVVVIKYFVSFGVFAHKNTFFVTFMGIRIISLGPVHLHSSLFAENQSAAVFPGVWGSQFGER